MRKQIIYCDYCGKEIDSKNFSPIEIHIFKAGSEVRCAGDICKECAGSFFNWEKDRSTQADKMEAGE